MIEAIVAITMLVIMEIVLGIDNVLFISLTANEIQNKKQAYSARKIGLVLALGVRIAMLCGISYLVHLTKPFITINLITEWFVVNHAVSFRDIILIAGGLFLIFKTVDEIHQEFSIEEEEDHRENKTSQFIKVVLNIVLIDIIFSFDSILTAVGLVDTVSYMIIAVIISMILMFFTATAISEFIEKRLP